MKNRICSHELTEFGHCVGCGQPIPTQEFQQKKQELKKLLNSEGYWATAGFWRAIAVLVRINKTPGTSGQIPCPNCPGAVVSYSVADDGRTVTGECSNGCVRCSE